MVVAGLRMQRWAKGWAAEKKVKAGLLKGLEDVRRRRREMSGMGTPGGGKGLAKDGFGKKV